MTKQTAISKHDERQLQIFYWRVISFPDVSGFDSGLLKDSSLVYKYFKILLFYLGHYLCLDSKFLAISFSVNPFSLNNTNK